MKNKRGISQIITTVIIIVLVLVAIGIVWGVIANVVKGSSEDVTSSMSCLGVQIKTIAVNNTGGEDYDITLKRLAGGESIAGLKILIQNNTASALVDFGQVLEELEQKTSSHADTGILNANKIEITPYISDRSGNEKLCQETYRYSFN